MTIKPPVAPFGTGGLAPFEACDPPGVAGRERRTANNPDPPTWAESGLRRSRLAALAPRQAAPTGPASMGNAIAAPCPTCGFVATRCACGEGERETPQEAPFTVLVASGTGAADPPLTIPRLFEQCDRVATIGLVARSRGARTPWVDDAAMARTVARDGERARAFPSWDLARVATSQALAEDAAGRPVAARAALAVAATLAAAEIGAPSLDTANRQGSGAPILAPRPHNVGPRAAAAVSGLTWNGSSWEQAPGPCGLASRHAVEMRARGARLNGAAVAATVQDAPRIPGGRIVAGHHGAAVGPTKREAKRAAFVAKMRGGSTSE